MRLIKIGRPAFLLTEAVWKKEVKRFKDKIECQLNVTDCEMCRRYKSSYILPTSCSKCPASVGYPYFTGDYPCIARLKDADICSRPDRAAVIYRILSTAKRVK